MNNDSDTWSNRNHPVVEDMGFQRKSWRVQTVGWGMLAMLLVATLLGLFSGGPLSHARLATGDGRLEMEYQRFHRLGAPAELHLAVRREQPGQPVEIVLGGDFMADFSIEGMRPEPAVSWLDAGGFHFQLPPSPGAGAEVRLVIRPRSAGLVDATVAVAGGPPMAFTQFIYP